MATIPNIADLQYGGFYIPIFSLAYIQEQFLLPVELPFPVLEIMITSSNFGGFLLIAGFGALIEHGINRSIFGPGGALKNPKNPWVVKWHKILFLVKPEPGVFPESREDLEEKIGSSVEYFESCSSYKKAKLLFTRGVRVVLFGGAGILFSLLVFSLTAFFLLEAYRGSLDYLGYILIIAQVVFFFGSNILGRFPSVVNPDAAPWIYVPEYKKSKILKNRDEIEFEYDPTSFFELEQWLPTEETVTPDDAEYLISLPEED